MFSEARPKSRRVLPGQGLAAQKIPDPLIDSLVGGRYHVLSEIGQGKCGRVYLATDKSGAAVAVKLPAPGDQASETLLNEIGVLASVRHRGIIGFLDSGTETGRPFLVMEYFRHPDLRQVLAEHGPLRPRVVRATALRMCDAFQALHSSGIAYGQDLNLHNVLYGKNETRLIDFGFATWLPAASGAEGTAIRTDVHSLGAFLYRLLTGARPFRYHGLRNFSYVPLAARDGSLRHFEDVEATIQRAIGVESCGCTPLTGDEKARSGFSSTGELAQSISEWRVSWISRVMRNAAGALSGLFG